MHIYHTTGTGNQFESEKDDDDEIDDDDDEEQESGNKPPAGVTEEPQSVDEAWKEKLMNEEETDDPEVQELRRQLDDVIQSGNLEAMRNLHRELHARHVIGRQETLRRLKNLI